MAIVTRYFSTAASGAGDGTSWANRAVLFTGGAWSTVITGFNFASTDSMLALIGPGTHTITVALASGSFANPPTVANPLILHGCDGSGNQLSEPDSGWVSASPAWSASSLPILATTTNVATINLATAVIRLLKFTASGRTGGAVIQSAQAMDWFHLDNSTANTATDGIGSTTTSIQNGVINMTGSSYNAGVVPQSANIISNCRIVGVTGSSGDRRGVENGATTSAPVIQRCTIVGHGGAGIGSASTNAGQLFIVSNCVIANNGGTGIECASTASQTALHRFRSNMITGNGAYGCDAQSAARIFFTDNRLRDNTSGNMNGFGNWPTDLGTYTTDSDDSSEYVDASGGDYRIKATATIAGRGFGVAQQCAGGGSGGFGFVG